ncbi:MAG: DUF1667 domain-containing protein [Treponema sp.]|nr:DUF1667 domain-containing protein [Treponema sp.]
MKELTCIICPAGCPLLVASAEQITGNRCPRGVVYAREETSAPKRMVTATCAAVFDKGADDRNLYAPRRVPVKTSSPCPREKIPALLADIYDTKVALPVKLGDVIISDWNGSGLDVVATRSIA